jgi:hypothetical protein
MSSFPASIAIKTLLTLEAIESGVYHLLEKRAGPEFAVVETFVERLY